MFGYARIIVGYHYQLAWLRVCVCARECIRFALDTTPFIIRHHNAKLQCMCVCDVRPFCTNCKRILPDHLNFYLPMTICEWCFAQLAIAMETFVCKLQEWAPPHAIEYVCDKWMYNIHIQHRCRVDWPATHTHTLPHTRIDHWLAGIIFHSIRAITSWNIQISFLLGKWTIRCSRTGTSKYVRAECGLRTLYPGISRMNERNCRNLFMSGKYVISNPIDLCVSLP